MTQKTLVEGVNMIEWSEIPPEEASCPNLPIKRTPVKGTLKGICVNRKIVGCWTHFFGGQTIPCSGANCPACQASSGRRWHGYMAAYNPEERTLFIAEFTAIAIQPMLEVQERTSDLRGVKFEAFRLENRPNARIKVRMSEQTRGQYQIPAEVDVKLALRNIWKVDSTTRFKQAENYEKDVIQGLEEGEE